MGFDLKDWVTVLLVGMLVLPTVVATEEPETAAPQETPPESTSSSPYETGNPSGNNSTGNESTPAPVESTAGENSTAQNESAPPANESATDQGGQAEAPGDAPVQGLGPEPAVNSIGRTIPFNLEAPDFVGPPAPEAARQVESDSDPSEGNATVPSGGVSCVPVMPTILDFECSAQPNSDIEDTLPKVEGSEQVVPAGADDEESGQSTTLDGIHVRPGPPQLDVSETDVDPPENEAGSELVDHVGIMFNLPTPDEAIEDPYDQFVLFDADGQPPREIINNSESAVNEIAADSGVFSSQTNPTSRPEVAAPIGTGSPLSEPSTAAGQSSSVDPTAESKSGLGSGGASRGGGASQSHPAGAVGADPEDPSAPAPNDDANPLGTPDAVLPAAPSGPSGIVFLGFGILLLATLIAEILKTSVRPSRLLAWAVGQFSRLQPDAILEQESREKIMQAIQNRSGVRIREIAQVCGVARSSVRYHVTVLARHKKVAIRAQGRSKFLFSNDASAASHSGILDPRRRAILGVVGAHPGATQSFVRQTLGLTTGTAHRELASLVEAGSIRAAREGRFVRYMLA